MSSPYNSKSSAINKIPSFIKNNFAMWKSKAIYDMLNIVEYGPYIPMYQPIVENVAIGPKKQKPKVKGFMTRINEVLFEEYDSSFNTFDDDPLQGASESKMKIWNPSPMCLVQEHI